MVCLTIGNVPGMLCMISEIRGGKDLLHNLTTTVVKNVSLPVGGSHLSLLSLAGIVRIIYHTPTSCCLLLLSFIIFWVSPFPAVEDSLQAPPPTCLVLYWAQGLVPILQNREWRWLWRALTSLQPQEFPAPHSRFGVLIHKAMAQDRPGA